MNGVEYYAIVLLIYFGTDLLAAWGLNLEFGVTGVANLAYIVVVAAGAYTYSVLTLGPPAAAGGFQQYIIGLQLPFPLALLGAAMAGALVGVLIGITGLKRLRQDYQAMVMLVVSLMAATVVSADGALFNGNAGLSLIPNPYSGLGLEVGGWAFVATVAALCLAGFFVVRRFTTGPMGRTLRAVRDDEHAAAAIGKSVVGTRLLVQAVGGALAGVSGAMLAAFIGGWSPSAWAYVETLALLTAVIVGGMGNDAGVSLGTLLVAIVILQGVQFLPEVPNHPGLREDFGWMILGILTVFFIWVKPQGIFPERRPRYRWGAATVGAGAAPSAPAPPIGPG